MADFKAASSDRFAQFIFGLSVDQRVQFAFGDAIEERANFVFLAVNLKLHAAIRQVTDPPGHIEALGYVADGEAKTNALNAALVKYLKRDHGLFQETGYWIFDAGGQS